MDRLYFADGHAWIGEHWAGRFPPDAVAYCAIPDIDDPRWVRGMPSVLDTQVLTLCPFYPSGRLGASVEINSGKPRSRYPNHPPFQGCVAWMPLDDLRASATPTN